MKSYYPWVSIFCTLLAVYSFAREGFSPDTLVHISENALPISTLTLTTSIPDGNRDLHPIVATTKVFADHYIKLAFFDGGICVGCKQRFCTHVNEWICAEDLNEGDALLDFSGGHHVIQHIERVNELVMLYALTVKDHVFCIEPYGLLVHNMAAAFGTASISLGAISITNPVATALGVTLALSVVANRALDAWDSQQRLATEMPPESVTLSERVYYESRKQDLEKLKNELLRIKNDLQTIKTLCNPNSYSFTYLLLSKACPITRNTAHSWLTVAKGKELQLTKIQQQELRLLRQQDLLVKEHEIIELQTALSVHSNELLGQVDTCCADYRAMLPTVNSTFEQFQRGYLDTKTVGQLYGCLLTQEYTLERIARKIQEGCLVGDYYQRLPRPGSCIASSTTIIEKWQQVLPCVRLNTKWIEQDKRTCGQRILCIEDYLRKRGGSVTTFKAGLVKTIEKHLKAYETTSLTAAVNKLETVAKKTKSAAQLPTEEVDQKEETKTIKTVEDVLADAEASEEKQECKQFIKPDGYTEALKDFESLGPTGIKDISKNGQKGLTGVLPDGRHVNVRERSTDKRPTLEIQPHKNSSAKSIKIRYGTK